MENAPHIQKKCYLKSIFLYLNKFNAMKKLIALLFPAFFTCCFPILGKTQTNPTDSLALVALYNATNGANWTNTWDLSQAVVTWHGVTLDVTGFVIDLDLRNNQLNGNIPPEIGNLSKLVYLFLDNNQLNGNIPPELGNLSNLIILHLPENQLSGSIPPEIGNLSNLEFLRLNNNQLSGSIPSEIGNLTNLGGCWLYINQLSGNVPSEIGNLSNLTTLSLDSNQLSGTIPSEIGNLTNLGYLALGDNQLSGNIPPEIGNLANLTYLFLDNNQLSGSYDANLLNLCNQLTFFFISEVQYYQRNKLGQYMGFEPTHQHLVRCHGKCRRTCHRFGFEQQSSQWSYPARNWQLE